MLQPRDGGVSLETEKPRWHKALDNLKQFASLPARLENELSDAHRELSRVRGDYLQLGLRCSALASERDALRRRVVETERYVEVLHAGSELAGLARLESDQDLHQRLTSLQEELDQWQRRYSELATQLDERDQKIEALQQRVAGGQAREAELVAELKLLQQRFDSVERDAAEGNEKNRALLAELDSLRANAADAEISQRQQLDELQQHLDASSAALAQTESMRQARDRQLDALRDELSEVHAKLAQVQADYRDREIAIAERDQELEVLEGRLTEHRGREVELDAQYTELSRRFSAAEREHVVAIARTRQQLEALQQNATGLQGERDTARQEAQSLKTQLARVQADVEKSKSVINNLEWQLGEASRGRETLQDNLVQLESERKQLLSRESELAELLGKAGGQLNQLEQTNEALTLGSSRERRMLWAALAFILILLAGLLLQRGGLGRDAPLSPPDIADALPGDDAGGTLPGHTVNGHTEGGEMPLPVDGGNAKSASEPLVLAYLMGDGKALSGSNSACVQWGEAGGQCLYLDAAAFDESVIHLDSGVKYKVISSGTGVAPQPGDRVVMKYRGTLLDGTEFDNSELRGGTVTLGMDELIPGLREALQRMEEGARWVVYIPAELGYPAFGVLGGETVVFDVELVAVGMTQHGESEFASVQWLEEDSTTIETARDANGSSGIYRPAPEVDAPPVSRRAYLPEDEWAFFAANATYEGVISLPSGLQYLVLEEGDGRLPTAMDVVVLAYRVLGLDRIELDSTTRQGQPLRRYVNELDPGLQEAVLGMREGGRRELYVPRHLAAAGHAHASAGTGPQPLIYEIELVSIGEEVTGLR